MTKRREFRLGHFLVFSYCDDHPKYKYDLFVRFFCYQLSFCWKPINLSFKQEKYAYARLWVLKYYLPRYHKEFGVKENPHIDYEWYGQDVQELSSHTCSRPALKKP